MTVSEWMTAQPYSAKSDDLIEAVAGAMQRGRFRHVPVVDADGKLIGIVTDGDLREHKGYLAVTKVSAVLSQPAIAIGPDEPIERAAQLLLSRGIRGLPVIDATGRVLGIVTTSDLLRGLLGGTGPSEGTTRIELNVRPKDGGFAEVVRAIEQAGGVIVGLGTRNAGDGPRYSVSVASATAAQALEAVRASGFASGASCEAG